MDKESEIEMNRSEDLYELGLEKRAFSTEEYEEAINNINGYYNTRLHLELSGDMENE